MPPIIQQLFDLLERGTLPVMIPLVLTCLGIGILTVDRLFYLYDPRTFLALLPP